MLRRLRNRDYNINRDNDRGAVAIVLAVFALLLGIFMLGYGIDLPTSHTAMNKVQSALDVGATHGAFSVFGGYDHAAGEAFWNAEDYLNNDWGGGSIGSFANSFGNSAGDAGCAVIIPKWDYGAVNHHVPTDPSGSGAATCLSPFQIAINAGVMMRVLDPTSSVIEEVTGGAIDDGLGIIINDYRNAVGMWGHFTPNHYFPFLENRDIRAMSVSMLKPVMTYVLFTRAFSLNDAASAGGNYDHIWGDDEDVLVPDNNHWPTYNAVLNGENLGAWTFPNTAFESDPRTGAALIGIDPNYAVPGGSTTTALQRIRNFYAAMCDSAPWAYYKNAAVSLLDKLGSSSAFDSTTHVGITGTSLAYPVIKLHPYWAVNDGGNSVANHTPNAVAAARTPIFPLVDPARGITGSHNEYLHKPKPEAFTGFVNPTDGAFNATAGLASGENRWTLCLCREYYRNLGATSYVTGEDLNYEVGGYNDTPTHHSDIARRRRSSLGANWCTDNITDTDRVTLSEGRDGLQHGTGMSGDTPRNLIANLAMELVNPVVSRVYEQPTAPDFAEPIGWNFERPLFASDPTSPLDNEVHTGLHRLATSLNSAITDIRGTLSGAGTATDAVTDYQSITGTNAWRVLRPLADREMIVVFAPGPFNPRIVSYQNPLPTSPPPPLFSPLGIELALLEGVISSAVCNGVRVFLAFMPMDFTEQSYIQTFQDNVVSKFVDYFEWLDGDQQAAAPPVPNNCATPGNMAELYFFVVNYNDFGGTDAERKMRAAAHFNNVVPSLIMREIVQVDFPA